MRPEANYAPAEEGRADFVTGWMGINALKRNSGRADKSFIGANIMSTDKLLRIGRGA